MTREPLKVGDMLWMVESRRGGLNGGRTVTVTKIGRKWATLDFPSWRPYRIDMETWRVDGGEYSSPARCYASEEVFQQTVRLDASWRRLVERLPYSPPPGIDQAWIDEAMVRLGIKP
tara:strand:- start:679 stop:1029 length:351 start_codon:yes stop_codon:yes gene_type:complete